MHKFLIGLVVTAGICVPAVADASPRTWGASGPAATAAPAAQDDGPPERIRFAKGTDHGSVTDVVAAGRTDTYVFGAAAGQFTTVTLTDGASAAAFTVVSPGGAALSAGGISEWSGVLPTSGEFRIKVSATETVRYTLNLQITASAPVQQATSSWEPPSRPVADPAVDVVPMVEESTTECDGAHVGMQAYTNDGALLWCGGDGFWVPLEFEGKITYFDDDRYPLRLGSHSAQVRFVQSMLVALGFDVGRSGADGYYGIDTYLAVFQWQRGSGQPVTAAVTIEDMNAMRAQLGSGTPSPTATVVSRSALENVSVPSICGHPAGTLVNGELPLVHDPNGPDPGYLSLGDEVVSVDLDADGTAEIAAVFHCSAGGVSWPDHVVIFGSGLNFLADINLADVFPDVYRGTIHTLSVVGGRVAVSADIETDGANQSVNRSFTIGVDQSGNVVIS